MHPGSHGKRPQSESTGTFRKPAVHLHHLGLNCMNTDALALASQSGMSATRLDHILNACRRYADNPASKRDTLTIRKPVNRRDRPSSCPSWQGADTRLVTSGDQIVKCSRVGRSCISGWPDSPRTLSAMDSARSHWCPGELEQDRNTTHAKLLSLNSDQLQEWFDPHVDTVCERKVQRTWRNGIDRTWRMCESRKTYTRGSSASASASASVSVSLINHAVLSTSDERGDSRSRRWHRGREGTWWGQGASLRIRSQQFGRGSSDPPGKCEGVDVVT
ncbi:hypothetical protein C8Q74DRAFT_1425335 [Fomes fomentarius]|nr:hypothetical protein C8Q74DRAFT_1425335 [Fomes fomentarius]